MIQEAYVSFEVAKLLKEKGFDESCYQKYDSDGELSFNHIGYINNEKPCDDFYALAPTHQMAMKWLRTKHIIIVVQPKYFSADGICSFGGIDIWADDNYEELQGDYSKYEEAVEVALKFCLENLI